MALCLLRLLYDLAAPAGHLEHHTDARHLLEKEILAVFPHQAAGESLERSVTHYHRCPHLVSCLLSTDVLAHLYFGIAHGAELKHLFDKLHNVTGVIDVERTKG